MALSDDQYGLEPAKKGAGTAVADDYGLEKATAGEAPPAAEATEENLPGSTPRLRAAVNAGVAKMAPPTKFEQDRPQIPENYGFTPGNVLKNAYQGAKELAGSTAKGAYDLAFGEANPETGQLEHGVGGLVGLNTKGEFAPLQRASALGKEYITDPARAEIEKAKEENAQGHTLGAIGHGAAAAVPVLGPWASSLGEQAGTGDVGGAAGKVAGQVGLGELAAKAPGIAKAGLKATGGAGLGLGLESEDLLTKGVRPRARAQGWQEAIGSPGVQRAIKEYDAATPIQNIEDFHDAIGPMKQKLWDDKVQPALDRQGPRPVTEMGKAATAVRDAITPQMREFDPAGVANLETLAGKLDKSRTVSEASDLQKYANAQLESYFGKYPAARRSAMNANPEIIGWETARRAIREQLNETLEDAGDTQAAEARQDYGHLTTIEKELERKVNPNERKAPVDLARTLGLIGAIPSHGVSIAAGELVHRMNDPNRLLRRGIAKLNPPPEAPFTPPAPYFKPLEQFPAGQGAVGPSTAPVQGPAPPPGNFQLENLQPNRTALWQQQVGAPPDLETGAPRAPYNPPIGPQPAIEAAPAPIHGEQMPLNLPGAHHELFNLPQTPTVGGPPEIGLGDIKPTPAGGAPGAIGGPGREGPIERIGTEKYKPTEKAQTLSAPRKVVPEAEALNWQEEINRNKEILRNDRATPEDKRIAQSRIDEMEHIRGGAPGEIKTAKATATPQGVKLGAGEDLGEGLGTEHVITKNGERIGSITIEPKDGGKSLHVHWLGGEFGPELKTNLLEAIEKQYPDAEKFTYDRRRVTKSGAKTEAREMKIKKE
jgi:hypothetical protein